MFQGVPRWLFVFGIVLIAGLEIVNRLPDLLLISQKLAGQSGEYGAKAIQPEAVSTQIAKTQAEAQLAEAQARLAAAQANKAAADSRLADAQTTKTNLDSAGQLAGFAFLGALAYGGYKAYQAVKGDDQPASQQSTGPDQAPAQQQSSSFEAGRADWYKWHNWELGLSGDALAGVHYWAGVRSNRPQPSCEDGGTSQDFLDGCRQARRILGVVDQGRLSNPEYRQGWNAGAKEME